MGWEFMFLRNSSGFYSMAGWRAQLGSTNQTLPANSRLSKAFRACSANASMFQC